MLFIQKKASVGASYSGPVLQAVAVVNTSSGTTLDITKPTGTSSSDKVILFAGSADVSGSTTVAAESGFTQRGSTVHLNAGGGIFVHVAMFESNTDVSASDPYTITWGGATLNGFGLAYRVSGIIAWDSTAGFVTGVDTSNLTIHPTPAFTTTNNNSLVLGAFLHSAGSSITDYLDNYTFFNGTGDHSEYYNQKITAGAISADSFGTAASGKAVSMLGAWT